MNFLFAFAWFPLDSPLALYAMLFLTLVLSGVGLPVPEEVTLVFGGYLAYLQLIDFWDAVYVMVAGIIAADIMGFMLGRYGMARVSRLLLRWRPLEAVFKKVEALFARYGDAIVVLSRPLAGVRVAVPIFAGYAGMRFWKFLALDLVAAVPWTIALVSLSYYLGSGFDLLIGVRLVRHALFAVIGLAIVSVIAVRWIRLRA